MTLRAVFFDAGHTLLQPWPRLGEIYRGVCRRHGFDIDADRVEQTLRSIWRGDDPEFGVTAWQDIHTSDEHDREMWVQITRLLIRKLDWNGFAFDPWFDDLYGVFGTAEVWRLYDDVRPALSALADRGLRVGIISNWDSRLSAIVDQLELTAGLSCVLASGAVGVRKPDPAIFRRALQLTGVAPAEAAMVGDTPRDDVEGARAAGMTGVLLDRAGHAGPAPGTPVVRSLLDLPQVLGLP